MTEEQFDLYPEAAPKADDRRNSTDTVAHDQLKSLVERIERMEEEKKAVADDIREIYTEAKGNGFDTKVLRQLIRRRKMDHDTKLEQDALLELYEGVFG